MMNSLLQEDIFFEIAEEFEEEDYDEQFETIQRKRIPKLSSCILFLNNVNKKLIDESISTNASE